MAEKCLPRFAGSFLRVSIALMIPTFIFVFHFSVIAFVQAALTLSS
jgi:hypothetical protein